tara:strand:+ start:288 stop:506 length:219 start_codon:yes stop_codon:yes gene_type:complete
MAMTYKYVDSNTKKNENILSVDFTFDGDVSMDDAIAQIDAMISQVDNDGDIEFDSHSFRMYTVSHLSNLLVD